MIETYDQIYKIILAGDAGVGKTHIVHKFSKGAEQGTKGITPTIGVEFATKVVRLSEGKKTIKAQIWDTAGSEQYRALTSAHYRRAFGALVIYDITKEQSFHSIKRWVEDITEQADQRVVVVLVANKIDLRSQQTVSTVDAKRVAKELGILFEEVSAKDNINIEQTFMTMFEEIHRRRATHDTVAPRDTFYLSNVKTTNDKCDC